MVKKHKSLKSYDKKVKKSFKKKHCSLKNCSKEISCLDNKLLIKIADVLNEYHEAGINLKTSRNKLHQQISKKLNKMSDCDSEKCWLTIQELIKHLSPEELSIFKKSFKPKKPCKWSKNPNEWLTTSDLEKILEQLTDKYPDFHSYGALPMDFDLKQDKKCVSGDICNIDLKKHMDDKKFNIGSIFNLDDHDEPGSHWVAVYLDLNSSNRDTPSIYYFDSIADKPTKEIKELVKNVKEQYKNITTKELDFLYNDMKHQYNNTECGIYCLHFLETMLKGVNFEDYINDKKKDDYMEKFRQYYFIEE